MSSRCDIFGDRIGSIEAGEELSFAQKVALECREDMCRLMYASRVHESELSFMMQTCGSGAITILCNTIVTVHLAGDDNELRYMTVLRAILRKTERLERIGYLKEFVNAAADLYNFYAGSKKNREDHPLSPLSLVLQSCSLLCKLVLLMHTFVHT